MTTTLDVRVQEAAAAALQGQTSIASLVAVRPSTGEILADANVNNGGFDYGARAKVPPGSTFKVVTTLAHLRKGLTPEQIVPCPATLNVDGFEFSNAGGFSLGDVPFSLDFARSCNTAFAGLADDLAPDRPHRHRGGLRHRRRVDHRASPPTPGRCRTRRAWWTRRRRRSARGASW